VIEGAKLDIDMNSDAVILAGGKGTRLQSVLSDRPKPMAEIGGRPFLDFLIENLRMQEIRRVILCTGYLGSMIEDYFHNGSGCGMEILYSHESAPLGTAGAVRNALAFIHSNPFFLLNGDSYCNWNASDLLSAHVAKGARATIWLASSENCSRYGSVVIDQDGAIASFSEKNRNGLPGLINAGVYCLERSLIETIPAGKNQSMETDLFPALVGKGLYAMVGSGPFIDIGTPESLKEALNVLGPKLP
jgi:NDP-sugar pyrophosphorylase family protein